MSSQGKKRETSEVHFSAYLVWVEGEYETYFTPEAVCIVYPDQVYKVYALDSRHNFLRAAILKHPLGDLQGDGVFFRDSTIRLEDLTELRARKELDHSGVVALLAAMYADNPRLYFFLERHVIRD
ncbi:MAG: hypothetical protein OWT28_12625 [Firmicutes bacterium]|nr:hypothetical protein [Bacillota bacterium]